MSGVNMGSRLNYRFLFEEGAEGMMVLTCGGSVLDANSKARGTLRRRLEYLKAAGRDGVFDPNDPRVESAFKELKRTGEFEGEIRLLRWNGAPFPAEVSMSGFGEGLVSMVFRDATEREQTREEFETRVVELTAQLDAAVSNLADGERLLRESEKLFEVTFEQAAVGIAHLEPDGRWIRLNRRLCGIVGYEREELLGKRFQDITHPDDLAKDLQHARLLLDGEIAEYSTEKRYIRKDGSTVWVNLAVSLARRATEEPGYFISVVKDIDRRKRSDLVLRSLTPREVEVLRLVGRGYTNARIALSMNFSEGSVKRHVQRIAGKLGVSNRSEAAARAVELGMVEPE